MAAIFWLDPDYRDFVAQQTPLKFSTLYRGGGLDFALVVLFTGGAGLLLAWCAWLLLHLRELSVMTVVLVGACVGLVAVLRWGLREVRRYAWARQTFPRLQRDGVVLAGTLTASDRRVVSAGTRLPSQHFVDIDYSFTTPDGRLLAGRQSRQREDLRRARLRAAGTPVRVLWVQDSAGEAWVLL